MSSTPNCELPVDPPLTRTMVREPAQFVDRQSEVAAIRSYLSAGQSVWLLGARGSGKSSLLYYIYKTAKQSFGDHFECYYLDMQRVLGSYEFFDRACDLLAEKGKEFAVQRKQLRDHREFEKLLLDRKVIFCLDDFDWTINNSNFGSEFFNILRSLAQTGELVLLVAANIPLRAIDFEDVRSSPLATIFSELKLGPLSKEGTLEFFQHSLKKAGLNIDHAEVERFLHAFDRLSPNQIQMIVEGLYEKMRRQEAGARETSDELRELASYSEYLVQGQRLVSKRTDLEDAVVKIENSQKRDFIRERRLNALSVFAFVIMVGTILLLFSASVNSSAGVYLSILLLLASLFLSLVTYWVPRGLGKR